MANLSSYSITFEIDPIVHLMCLNAQCRYNNFPIGSVTCNLKHIVLNGQGQCTYFEKRVEDERTQAETIGEEAIRGESRQAED